MVEQRPVAVRRLAQLLQIVGEQLDVVRLNRRALLELRRIVLVMRQVMVRLVDAQLRIRPTGLFAPVHERNHACQVGLVGQKLQIVEQRHVSVECVRNARGPVDVRHLLRTLFLGLLDPPLHVAQRRQVVVHLRAVCGAERPLELPHTIEHRVENAPVLAEAGRAHASVGAVGRAEQPLEHDARVVFRHQGQRRREPGQRAAVRTAVAHVARSNQAVLICRQLQ